MSVQRSTIPRAGVAAVLAVCVALPVVTRVKNGPLEENPGHQVDEILGGIGILSNTIHVFSRGGGTKSCDVPFPRW